MRVLALVSWLVLIGLAGYRNGGALGRAFYSGSARGVAWALLDCALLFGMCALFRRR